VARVDQRDAARVQGWALRRRKFEAAVERHARDVELLIQDVEMAVYEMEVQALPEAEEGDDGRNEHE